jgi:hypothetical protein
MNRLETQLSELKNSLVSVYVEILEARWRLDNEDDRNVCFEATGNAVDMAEAHLVETLKKVGVDVAQIKATALIGFQEEEEAEAD